MQNKGLKIAVGRRRARKKRESAREREVVPRATWERWSERSGNLAAVPCEKAPPFQARLMKTWAWAMIGLRYHRREMWVVR